MGLLYARVAGLGQVITASGLVFIGATMDSHARAIEIGRGKVLCLVDAPAMALPAVYTYKGKLVCSLLQQETLSSFQEVSDWFAASTLPD